MIASFLLAIAGALLGFRTGYTRMAGDAVTFTCWTLAGLLAGGALGELLTSFGRERKPTPATAPSFPPANYRPEPVRRPVADVDRTLEMDKQQEPPQPPSHEEATAPADTSEHPPIAVQRNLRRLV